MPEGPEIRRAADKVAEVLAGQQIVEVQLELPAIKPFEPELVFASVTGISTRGKAMLTRFDNGLTLYSHNQLYGRWFTSRRGSPPRTGRQLRVGLHTPTHSALLYSASDIEILTDAELDAHPFLSRLGPDILDPALTEQAIVDRLRSPAFCNRALGGLYLDQGFLAGNGNYLRSEILWCAGIEPSVRPRMLSIARLRRLARETLRVTRRSYRTRGVTVSERRVRALKAQGLGYEKYRFHVFGRDGLDCYRCSSKVERRTMGSRNLFVCPGCQAG